MDSSWTQEVFAFSLSPACDTEVVSWGAHEDAEMWCRLMMFVGYLGPLYRTVERPAHSRGERMHSSLHSLLVVLSQDEGHEFSMRWLLATGFGGCIREVVVGWL